MLEARTQISSLARGTVDGTKVIDAVETVLEELLKGRLQSSWVWFSLHTLQASLIVAMGLADRALLTRIGLLSNQSGARRDAGEGQHKAIGLR